MKIAVLGGGITGAMSALTLSEMGHDVHLFDKNSSMVSAASQNNEGKIHLGYVYANDSSGQTARAMISGAVRFERILARYIPSSVIRDALSSPIVYAIPRDSRLSDERIAAHFDRVDRLFEEATDHTGRDYFGIRGKPHRRRLSKAEFESHYDPDSVSCAFQTIERAVDPRPIAAALRQAIAEAPRINCRPQTTVERVEPLSRGGYCVRYHHDSRPRHANFDGVVNALWQERARVDAAVFDEPAGSSDLVHRFKIGFIGNPPHSSPEPPPLTTLVLGSFGDFVSYPTRCYLSWYPEGLLSQEFGLFPRKPLPRLDQSRREQVFARSVDELARYLPGLGAFVRPNAEGSVSASLDRQSASGGWQCVGGYISARGNSGIERMDSQLHRRYEIGLETSGAYVSVDSGKYTTGPDFAVAACNYLSDSIKLTA